MPRENEILLNNEYVIDDQFVASYHIAGVIRCIQGTRGLCHMSMLSAVSHIHIYMVGGKIAVRENKQTLVHSSPSPESCEMDRCMSWPFGIK